MTSFKEESACIQITIIKLNFMFWHFLNVRLFQLYGTDYNFRVFVCIGGNFCFYHEYSIFCKLTIWVRQATLVIPEYLNLLLSIDRLVAVCTAVWYRNNCTRKTSWIAIGSSPNFDVAQVNTSTLKIAKICKNCGECDEWL